jgi:N-carbamoylputrescine amidase
MAPPTKFKIGLVQMRCSEDPADNLARALQRIRDAARDGARLVCLPSSIWPSRSRAPAPKR